MNWKEKEMLKEYRKHISDELFKDLSKDMTRCYSDYSRHKMLASIIDTIHDIDMLLGRDDMHEETYFAVEDEPKEHELTEEQAIAWVSNMEITGDNTNKKGEHWSIDQTTAVAKQYGVAFDHIRPLDWWVAMNEVFTDNSVTAQKYGITDVGYYVDLAKDLLFDVDAVPAKEKLCYYYKYIVRK